VVPQAGLVTRAGSTLGGSSEHKGRTSLTGRTSFMLSTDSKKMPAQKVDEDLNPQKVGSAAEAS